MISRGKVQDAIARVVYHRLEGTNSVVCALVLTNGHVVIGEAHCALGVEFAPQAGMEASREDAERKVYGLLAYAERCAVAEQQKH